MQWKRASGAVYIHRLKRAIEAGRFFNNKMSGKLVLNLDHDAGLASVIGILSFCSGALSRPCRHSSTLVHSEQRIFDVHHKHAVTQNAALHISRQSIRSAVESNFKKFVPKTKKMSSFDHWSNRQTSFFSFFPFMDDGKPIKGTP